MATSIIMAQMAGLGDFRLAYIHCCLPVECPITFSDNLCPRNILVLLTVKPRYTAPHQEIQPLIMSHTL